MQALITGAAGFVGQWLARYLHERGWTVLCADRDCSACVGTARFTCDVSDRAQVDALLEWAEGTTHVFHLAAISYVPHASRNPENGFAVNLLGTVHLATCMRQRLPGARMVFVSSSEVYGPPQTLPVTEEHPLNPIHPYAIAKAAADQFCGYCHRAESLDVVRMRPGNHSGPGQSDSFVLSSFARQIARIEMGKLEPVIRVGNLAPARGFLHVRDVVRGYELAALSGKDGEAYNLCSGEAVSIRDALNRLLGMSAAEILIEPDPTRVRGMDAAEIRGSHDKFTRDTGWRPEIKFDTLLEDLLKHWRLVERL